jgi:protoporphyrinogen oxidase
MLKGAIDQSRRQFGYNARFWYPRKGGINNLPLAFASGIRNIYTDCRISEIDPIKKEVMLASGNKEKFDLLISTIPLPELPGLIKNIPPEAARLFKKLKWNSIFNINLGVTGRTPFRGHWIYFPQKDIHFFRTGFFHNFSSSLAPAGKSSLYAEVAYSKEKPINKKETVFDVIKDLKKMGILDRKKDILAQDINDIKYGYPIYDYNYTSAREGILKYLSQNDIICCGRYGNWRYMSMECAILDGERAAERAVNTA